MSETASPTTATFGWMAFGLGAISLIAALAVFWAGPFAPQQSAGVSLGELAAEITKSAARSMVGAPQPEVQSVARDIDDYLKVGVAVLGGLAVILGLVGFIKKEPMRAATAGITLGAGAILFQFVAWTIMLVVGALIIVALIHSLGDSFTSIFGG